MSVPQSVCLVHELSATLCILNLTPLTHLANDVFHDLLC